MRSSFGNRAQLGIGSFISMFIAAIAIAIILFFYAFYGMGLAKSFSDAKGGMIIYDENKVEIGSVLNYMNDNYISLVKARFLVERGVDVDNALKEVKNEK